MTDLSERRPFAVQSSRRTVMLTEAAGECLNSLAANCVNRLINDLDSLEVRLHSYLLVLYGAVQSHAVCSTNFQAALGAFVHRVDPTSPEAQAAFLSDGDGRARLMVVCEQTEAQNLEGFATALGAGPEYVAGLSHTEFQDVLTRLGQTKWQRQWSCHTLSSSWLKALRALMHPDAATPDRSEGEHDSPLSVQESGKLQHHIGDIV